MTILINSEKVAAMIEAIDSGLDLEVATAYAELSSYEVRTWLERGKKEEYRLAVTQNSKLKNSERVYYDMWVKVRKARSESLARMVHNVQDAAKEDWRAAAWYLERHAPEVYAKISDKEKIKEIANKIKELEQ